MSASTSWAVEAAEAVERALAGVQDIAEVVESLRIVRSEHAHDTRRRGAVDDLTRRLYGSLRSTSMVAKVVSP